ncbi:hypothetical protein DASC09_010330 [Saccharomycopsis crataegensis]|uniref:Sugar phosphate transporter domain-containing protein n=1 Tax=Saccharomycopsis crataegensis TaxID=43959 RepID=A0AAV5QFW2_9ASCO|nr:hypothetical protein DASC09_010330 [Saccharomycopsis crataegensis]
MSIFSSNSFHLNDYQRQKTTSSCEKLLNRTLAPEIISMDNLQTSTRKLSVSARVVILCLLWYGISSLTSQLSKAILTGFPYPLTLSQCQFFSAALLCCLTTRIVYEFPAIHRKFPKGSIPTPDNLKDNRFMILSLYYAKLMFPMGIFQFVGKFLSHAATSLIPVATASSIKTLNPLLIVLTYKLYYGIRFPYTTYLTLLPIAAGVMLIVTSNASRHTTGLSSDETKGYFFALASCFVFVVQNIYGKRVVTFQGPTDPASLALASVAKPHDLLPLSNNNSSVTLNRLEEKSRSELEKLKSYSNLSVPEANNHSSKSHKSSSRPDKLTVLLYCSVFGATLSLPVFLFSEFPKILGELSQAKVFTENLNDGIVLSETSTLATKNFEIPWGLLCLNGLAHFCQALLAFHLLGSLPTVTYSVASLLKRIVIITVGMLWANHFAWISASQFSGLTFIGIGLYAYDRFGGKEMLKTGGIQINVRQG